MAIGWMKDLKLIMNHGKVQFSCFLIVTTGKAFGFVKSFVNVIIRYITIYVFGAWH